jgi:hypothetical protein
MSDLTHENAGSGIPAASRSRRKIDARAVEERKLWSV